MRIVDCMAGVVRTSLAAATTVEDVGTVSTTVPSSVPALSQNFIASLAFGGDTNGAVMMELGSASVEPLGARIFGTFSSM